MWLCNTQTYKQTKWKVNSTQGAQYFLFSVYQLGPPPEGLYTSNRAEQVNDLGIYQCVCACMSVLMGGTLPKGSTEVYVLRGQINKLQQPQI